MKRSKKNPKRHILFLVVKTPQKSSKQKNRRHTSYQVPAPTYFGGTTKVPSSGSLPTTKFRRSRALTAATKAESLRMSELRTTHISRPVSTSAHCSTTDRAIGCQQFVLPGLCTQPSLSIPDRMGSPPAEAYDVSCSTVQRALQYTVHPSALATRLNSRHIRIYQQ